MSFSLENTIQEAYQDCVFFINAFGLYFDLFDYRNETFPTSSFRITQSQTTDTVADTLKEFLHLVETNNNQCPVSCLNGDRKINSHALKYIEEDSIVILIFAINKESGKLVILPREKYDNMCQLDSYMPIKQ